LSESENNSSNKKSAEPLKEQRFLDAFSRLIAAFAYRLRFSSIA